MYEPEPVLLERLQNAPAVGSRWQHYQHGAVVTVVGSGLSEPTKSVMIFYCHDGSEVVWVRLLTLFLEDVFVEGQGYVRRFTPYTPPKVAGKGVTTQTMEIRDKTTGSDA